MHELCALGMRSDFVTSEAWNRYRKNWTSADFNAKFKKASQNRNSEKDSPGTSYLKHTGGSRSFWTYGEILTSVMPELVRRREGKTQATLDQLIDEEQLYYDAGGTAQRGVSMSLGHMSEGRKDMQILVPSRPVYKWCGVQSLMQLLRGSCSSMLSYRASWECIWTS
ncbi:hypothetical protein Scep_001888 [Stephania cephalantha]|uniref:Transposase n=1 Tax=Stephania cephalantha TaxID=152367 RepID=A0AAP0LAB4_9MAGN